MHWKVFVGSAIGKSHIEQNLPCQDFASHDIRNGIFVGVVCDGAGSARESRQGAEFFSRRVSELLSDVLCREGLPDDSPEAYRALVEPVVETVRSQLAAQVDEQGHVLRDYACTLVGCLVSAARGAFFHIGDGFAVQQHADTDTVLSYPENGEYADETYFVTEEDWRAHLRVVTLPPMAQGSFIGLMSDGASAFAIDRSRTGFYKPFIDPVMAYLSTATEQQGNDALQNLMESEKTLAITSDDKTLLLAFPCPVNAPPCLETP